jgi:hypothetical protein
MKDRRFLALLAFVAIVALGGIMLDDSASATTALTPVATQSKPPAGLSVDATEAAFGKGFEFKFRSDTSSASVTIDPLGSRHSDSASLSSRSGAISLSAKYGASDRTIVITAKRGGTSIGEYTWRVAAVLR